MKHYGTQRLETERLVLRRFTKEDALAMYQNWASDEEVTKYLTWPTHTCLEVSQKVIADWIKSYEKEDYYQWAIVYKEQGKPIGSISVVEKKEEISMVHIGYCIGRDWWHQGITSEALKAVMEFLFDVVGANRIEARQIHLLKQEVEKQEKEIKQEQEKMQNEIRGDAAKCGLE